MGVDVGVFFKTRTGITTNDQSATYVINQSTMTFSLNGVSQVLEQLFTSKGVRPSSLPAVTKTKVKEKNHTVKIVLVTMFCNRPRMEVSILVVAWVCQVVKSWFIL